jgi:hypothetical protein
MSLIPADALAAMMPVIRQFEQLGVNYFIGGSVASSLFGVPRSTLDVDLVAELRVDDLLQKAWKEIE